MFFAALATSLLDRTDEQVYRKVTNSVVEVSTMEQGDTVPSFSGTGFVVKIGGKTVVITARHVVDDLPVTVLVKNRLIKCEVWKDKQYDYAVLKPVTPISLPPLQFSSKTPVVGESCWMVGFPCPGEQPLQHVLSKFIINQYPVEDYERLGYIVGFGWRLTGGSSGSPVVDSSGQVISIACAYFPETTDISVGVGIKLFRYSQVEHWVRSR